MLTDKQKAIEVMRLINIKVQEATHRLINTNGDLSAHQAKRKIWAELNPNDGVGCISQNPYDSLEGMNRSVLNASEDHTKWVEIQKYFMERFINKL